MEECKRIKRELMYHGVVVDFYKDTMKMPNGHEVAWDLISHKGAAAVVAGDDAAELADHRFIVNFPRELAIGTVAVDLLSEQHGAAAFL